MSIDADVLILGQGLAGSTIAWRLAERGMSVVVIDRGGVDEEGRPSASRVAAGLITPVTGKRLTVADEFDTLWSTAEVFYRRVESQTGAALLSVAPAFRLFVDAEEHRRFLKRDTQGHAELARLSDLLALGVPRASLQCGAFVMPRAARLDVGRYLTATATWLRDRLIRAECDPGRELRVSGDHVAVDRLDVTARFAVLCTGHSPPPVRWLDGVNFAPAKGEVLTIRSRSLRTERVVHRGVWIAPEGDGLYRVGATTEWNRLNSAPTDEGRHELLRRLADAGVGDAKVVDHLAAVRPATPDRRPTWGFCSVEPRVGWLNGLGAKGSLWAPHYAERLADELSGMV